MRPQNLKSGKSIALQILGVLMLSLSVTACPGKKSDSGGGGGVTATTPTTTTCTYQPQSGFYQNHPQAYRDQNGNPCTPVNPNNQNLCIYYRYDHQRQAFVDQANQIVNCNQSYLDIQNGQIMPYYYYSHNYNYNDCSGWSMIYGASYVPANLGYGIVCVRQDLVQGSMPGGYYGGGTINTCIPGINCQTVCSGAGAGVQFGPLYFGGTLSVCF